MDIRLIRTYQREELISKLQDIDNGKLSLFTEKQILEELYRRDNLNEKIDDKINYPDLSHS